MKRVTAKRLKQAAALAKEQGVSVTIGEFTIHPPSANDAPDDDAKRVQERLDAMGRRP